MYKFREESWKYGMQWSIFYEIQGVWLADETLSLVFDVSSQSKQKLRSKKRTKIIKIYAWPGIQTSFTLVIFFVLTLSPSPGE